MKFFLLILKNLILITCIFTSWQCSSQKVQLENAKAQNIEFLVEQAQNLWDSRIDSNAIKKANYILGLAYEEQSSNSEIIKLYSKTLFFQGMFLENDKNKKDSLFYKGSEVAKKAVLNNELFLTLLNNTIGDSSFKVLSALSEAPMELVPAMYWWVTNKLWHLNSKPAIERINHRELLEIVMHRIISLDPNYHYGGAYRFFGVFYSRIPGVEINQSKTYFEKAISSNENYFGNKVQMAEFFYQKSENKPSFLTQLQQVINLDASIHTEMMPENIYYQKRAKNLLNQQDTLFE